MTAPALSPDAALYRLLSWMSPSYPVGAYTYSHGLEAAVELGHVQDEETACSWIADVVAHGGGVTDLVFLFEACAAARAGDAARLAACAELAAAFAPSEELLRETTAQGAAFADVTLAVADDAVSNLAQLRALSGANALLAHPVAVGCASAEIGVPARPAAVAYAHAFAANLVSACLRLAPVGQTAGQRLIARLQSVCEAAVDRAAATPIDAVGASALLSDICSMAHETQHTRLFRS